MGRYRLAAALSSGGMATVYIGRLEGAAGFSRTVAIKRVHANVGADPTIVAMLLDEARIVSRIRHPNVVPTIDVVAAEGELLLVMEYVHGESLSRLCRLDEQRDARSIPRPVALAVMIGVLEGLHAAHEATSSSGELLEVVHRDVSPQNVVVGLDGLARLIDFGIAKATGRLQETKGVVLRGKLSYMAPEQVAGKVSRRTDVYAAGVVLWELLTGRRLFAAESEVTTFARMMTLEAGPPSQLVPGLPPQLDRVVLRALAREPSDRFATAREFAMELAGVDAVATTREVSAWVERCAGPGLAARAAQIAAIERADDIDCPSTTGSLAALLASPPSPPKEGPLASPAAPLADLDRTRTVMTTNAVAHPDADLDAALPRASGKHSSFRRGWWLRASVAATVILLGVGGAVTLRSFTRRAAGVQQPAWDASTNAAASTSSGVEAS